jgi:hypothetical protein
MALTKQSYLRLFYVSVAIIYGALLVARLLWPATSEPFSDIWETISGLGHMSDNPVGFYFFQLSMTMVGVMVIPMVFYIHPRIVKYQRGNAVLGSFFLLIGGIGFLMTGLIPDGVVHIPEWDKFHEISAGLGFGGILFAAWFYFWPIRKAGDIFGRRVILFLLLLWWVPLILTGVSYGVAELVIKEQHNLGWYGPEWGEAGVSGFFSFAVWERVLFTVMLVYLGALGYILPEDA